MIKIIKYSKANCSPCFTQAIILKQLAQKVIFFSEERNVLETEKSDLVKFGITGVPHLLIYWNDELLYSKSGLVKLDTLLDILVDKLA